MDRKEGGGRNGGDAARKEKEEIMGEAIKVKMRFNLQVFVCPPQKENNTDLYYIVEVRTNEIIFQYPKLQRNIV